MKFVHIADVHLGANPEAKNTWGINRGKEIWDNFKAVIQYVKSNQIELLLISGDLFHRQPLKRELKEVNYLFGTIPDTTVVLVAGNHDYIIQGKSYYLEYPWVENVIGLWSEELERVYISHLHTYVYGLSYYSQEIRDTKYDHIEVEKDQEAYHILVAHGGDETHIPIRANTFLNHTFDYIALGHIHIPHALKANRAFYAGGLTPLDKTELGKRGLLIGSLSKQGFSCEFKALSQRIYQELSLTLEGQESTLEILDRIESQIKACGANHMYLITLKGFKQAHTCIQEEEVKKLGYVVSVVDELKVNWDLKELKRRYKGSLIEKYIEYFEGVEDTSIHQKALNYGLTALLEAKE